MSYSEQVLMVVAYTAGGILGLSALFVGVALLWEKVKGN